VGAGLDDLPLLLPSGAAIWKISPATRTASICVEVSLLLATEQRSETRSPCLPLGELGVGAAELHGLGSNAELNFGVEMRGE
jgi:hypothetical protein